MTRAPAPLALTLGDPDGVGPEIVVKAWRTLRHEAIPFVVIGDPAALRAAGADALSTGETMAAAASGFTRALPVIDPGKPDGEDTPSAVIRWITEATALALEGEASGVVTAPISKSRLYAAGFDLPGHTEFLAALTQNTAMNGPRGPVMMLTAADLRVVLATIHTPLARVPTALSAERIVAVAEVTAHALKADYGIAAPRLAMAGLNPHAGEDGTIGREEVDILHPAIAELRRRGVDISDPKPADTLFHPEARQAYDAVVCMYHDQAMIPVKTIDFWGGVNVTLGLPVVRTSPDHGTGFDIAGQGIARPDSLIAAIRMAAHIAANRALNGADA